ncbi:MAG: zf-HC2 domain-containing protein [Vicinamibacteraceae bacterium]|nr:zf-HC2 domain-containing protein [Vicinamibacteraceae bacterium]
MTTLSCRGVRARLSAYVDGELSSRHHHAVRQHLAACAGCAAEAEAQGRVRALLRDTLGEGALPHPDIDVMRASVVSRYAAERDQWIRTRLKVAFEDMHLVWAGLSATAAVCICAVSLVALWYFSPPERDDSIAGLISAMANPGSDRNPVSVHPRLQLPRVSPDAQLTELLANSDEEDLVLAVAAVVTQQGRVLDPSVVAWNRGDRASEVARLIRSLQEAQLHPATDAGGAPVAVNLVWVFSQTTVRPGSS